MKLNGVVAILDETGTIVVGVRDLGPKFVDIKPGRAKQLIDQKPALQAGEEYEEVTTFVINPNDVTRVFTTKLADTPVQKDDKVIAIKLAEDGGLDRAILLTMWQETNALRTALALPTRTKAQFLAIFRGNMR